MTGNRGLEVVLRYRSAEWIPVPQPPELRLLIPVIPSCDQRGTYRELYSSGWTRRRQMITRSKLVEQLRDYQIHSQQKWGVLIVFSPKTQILTWVDKLVAFSWALVFFLLVISSYITLCYTYFRFSALTIFLGFLLPVCLKFSRQRRLAKKRERRLLLPLSV